MKKISSGKVRDVYEVDKNSLVIVVSDRISAHDNIMPTGIREKGIILSEISNFWFDYVSDIVPNHIVSNQSQDFPIEFQTDAYIGRTSLVKRLKMLPVECVVRGYLSGSAWKSYQESGCVCDIKLPEDLKESEKLEEPIFTPAYKAEAGKHDENISFEKAIELIGMDLAEKVRRISIEIYNKCAEYALENGIILADTKFEFGLDEKGELVVGDELLTPDSSRFWSLDKYEVGKKQDSFDKQYLRDWLKENGYVDEAPDVVPSEILEMTRQKYINCYEQITGKVFERK